MAKQEYEIRGVDLFEEWRLIEGGYSGTMEEIFSYDPETGNYTRLLKFPPKTDMSEALTHDFCKEIYVVDGYLTDTKKNLTMSKGYCGSRLPGMLYGPYSIPLRCTAIELRYRDPGKPIDPEYSLFKLELGGPKEQGICPDTAGEGLRR